MDAARPRAFARMFSSAIVTQALLSAANLLVSLILIRRAPDAEYGYYVLITNGLLLLSTLQGAYLQPPLVLRMTRSDAAGRASLIGGMAHAQRRLLGVLATVAATVVTLGLLLDLAAPRIVLLLGAALGAAVVVLFREFYRMLLMAYRRPTEVLKADVLYVAVLITAAFAATLSPFPATLAALGIGVAAAAGAWLLSRAVQSHEPWAPLATPGILRAIAPIGAWSAVGAVTHWAFSQGYNYVAAGALDITAVAALAATRLTMMPINLLSAGMGPLLLPTASGWLQRHGAATVLRRLASVAAGLAVVTLCYFALLWFARDWIFANVMGKDFARRDELLLLWGLVFLVAVFRDQLLYLPGASGRFRPMAFITMVSALMSLLLTYLLLGRYGVIGAPLGVLAGEITNLLGILTLSAREVRAERAAATAPVT